MSWDTHVHTFNPERYPFRPSRAYTPQPACLDQLVQTSPAQHFVLVQASIEDGCQGVLDALAQAKQRYPDRQFRASIIWDPEDAQLVCSKATLRRLHAEGVRCVRVHGIFGQGLNGTAQVIEQLRILINSVLLEANWAVELQLPLETWADPALGEFLISDLCRNISVVADHCASVNASAAQTNQAFTELLGLLSRRDNLFVKLSALHRRCQGSLKDLGFVLRSFGRFEDSLLWGSDWPHVDSRARGLQPSSPLVVDIADELQLIRSCISEQAWEKMMILNPERVFAS